MKYLANFLVLAFLSFGMNALADDASLTTGESLDQDQHIILTDTLDAKTAGCLVNSGADFEVLLADKPGETTRNVECVSECVAQRHLCKQWHDPALCDAWWYGCMNDCGGFN